MTREIALKVAYDLTPYIRNPLGGIARVCANTFMMASKQSELKVFPFSNSALDTKNNYDINIIPISTFGKKYFGAHHDISHSLNHKLLQVKATKHIYTVHDVWSLQPNNYQDPAFQKKLNKRIRSDIKKADHIVTISETTRQNLLTLDVVKPTNCSTVYLGADSPLPEKPTANLKLAKLQKKKFVLYVGCLEVRKNIGHLLEAMKPFDDLSLVIAGNHGYGFEQQIEPLLAEFPQERLLILSAVSRFDLAFLYRQALALLLPSWEEGFGLPIVEAMTYGCPVITSNQSANVEIAAEGGILVDPYSSEESSSAIEKLVSDENYWNQKKQDSLKRVTFFSWEKYIQQLIEIYQNVLSNN